MTVKFFHGYNACGNNDAVLKTSADNLDESTSSCLFCIVVKK